MYKHILENECKYIFFLRKNNNKLLEIIQNHLILFTGTSNNQNKNKNKTPDTHYTSQFYVV